MVIRVLRILGELDDGSNGIAKIRFVDGLSKHQALHYIIVLEWRFKKLLSLKVKLYVWISCG